ncbi:Gfo/Idh/MocA family protein [Lysinibacter cavernae]|uniref:Putative dehydrogenase n=1 Tax=Lysinibacter cavernae TaxID=1640652 RepID=A0A7X5R097_9MICO|nr:Gfo/Idh/MocA family oxidoreductase [Lysinibacter cavernae]NIH53072.1 putative dehydrogenase [Lysinibacter cavernae]
MVNVTDADVVSPVNAAPLRIGVLGAARISTASVIKASQLTGDRLVAVAARDPKRAAEYAAANGFERSEPSYEALLAADDIDVIYNPLPNGLHAEWTIKALRAGKNVLSEKPFSSNLAEGEILATVAEETGGKLWEAFHNRHHPVMGRMLEIAASGEVGDVTHVHVRMDMPYPGDDDPRSSFALAGGGLMDVGCYAVHAAVEFGALLGGAPRITAATAEVSTFDELIDTRLVASAVYPNGRTASLHSSMSDNDVRFELSFTGTRGKAYAPGFVLPHLDDRVIVTVDGVERVEHLGTRTSYAYQLDAVRRNLRDGEPFAVPVSTSLTIMGLIDDAYRAAGLPVRPARVLE